jgi:hypothetical protein
MKKVLYMGFLSIFLMLFSIPSGYCAYSFKWLTLYQAWTVTVLLFIAGVFCVFWSMKSLDEAFRKYPEDFD